MRRAPGSIAAPGRLRGCPGRCLTPRPALRLSPGPAPPAPARPPRRLRAPRFLFRRRAGLLGGRGPRLAHQAFRRHLPAGRAPYGSVSEGSAAAILEAGVESWTPGTRGREGAARGSDLWNSLLEEARTIPGFKRELDTFMEFPRQYLGTWHFVAAAASAPTDLETFAGIDSSIFHMGRGPQHQRLQLRAALRLKSGRCMPRSWIYLLNEGSTCLATEGRPGMRTELFSSKCPDTIIVQESDRDYRRLLLYSRTPHLADDCIEDFRDQAYCLDMEEFLLVPRSRDTCQLQD